MGESPANDNDEESSSGEANPDNNHVEASNGEADANNDVGADRDLEEGEKETLANDSDEDSSVGEAAPDAGVGSENEEDSGGDGRFGSRHRRSSGARLQR